MGHRERLSLMKVRDLKREISKQNIKGYSKMKKAEVISLIIKNKSRFSHLFPKTTSSGGTQTDKPKPPAPAVAKKALAKKVVKMKKKITLPGTPATKKKEPRKRVYRFRVDGKEFKKTNDSWARIIENPGGLPIKQQPKLWSAAANQMYSKLRTRGLLKFKHNIKTKDKSGKPYQPLMLL